MAFAINKPSVWIPIALTIVLAVSGAVAGVYTQFTTKEQHVADHQAQQMEIAGVSLYLQQISTQQQIKWLEQELRLHYKKCGKPPYADPDVQADYEKLLRDLKDEREVLKEVRLKIKK